MYSFWLVYLQGIQKLDHLPGPQPHLHIMIPPHLHQQFMHHHVVPEVSSGREVDGGRVLSDGVDVVVVVLVLELIHLGHIHDPWRLHQPNLHHRRKLSVGRRSRRQLSMSRWWWWSRQVECSSSLVNAMYHVVSVVHVYEVSLYLLLVCWRGVRELCRLAYPMLDQVLRYLKHTTIVNLAITTQQNPSFRTNCL